MNQQITQVLKQLQNIWAQLGLNQKITLSATPTGADKKLRYALNAPVPQACPGPYAGARGNLRDSDTTQGVALNGRTSSARRSATVGMAA